MVPSSPSQAGPQSARKTPDNTAQLSGVRKALPWLGPRACAPEVLTLTRFSQHSGCRIQNAKVKIGPHLQLRPEMPTDVVSVTWAGTGEGDMGWQGGSLEHSLPARLHFSALPWVATASMALCRLRSFHSPGNTWA
jgi:hypothetical protein